MFKVNDHVFYSSTGVCSISDIRIAKVGGMAERECYVLKPLRDSHSILYVPTDQTDLSSHMRHLMTKDEIMDLIHAMPGEDILLIINERERSKEYYARVSSCDSHDLVRVIKSLHHEQRRRKATGKGLNTTDSRIMTAAENLLHEEFAFVLGIPVKEVHSFILEELQVALQPA